MTASVDAQRADDTVEQEQELEQELEQEQRSALAAAIVRRRDEIERRWLEAVTKSLEGRLLNPSELRNSMPDYLIRLADGLRGGGTVERGGSASWESVAREHAETRVRLRFDIDQLVQEFILLRQIIFVVVEREERMHLGGTQAARVADLIEGAIKAAVASYVRSRDDELRKRETEHIGFLTHELKNPLAAAMLATAKLRGALSLSPDQERTFAMLERNQRQLVELIDRVLFVEREVHRLHPEREVLTLEQLLEPVIGEGRLAAAPKGLELDARYDPDVCVYVDAKLTASAIANVVENAIKYTDSGRVEVVAESRTDHVALHVYDNCPGLTEEELRTIFEPFSRGHSQKPGTGLGLAIARRSLELQGGAISAEPLAERGCHFWVTLPKPRH